MAVEVKKHRRLYLTNVEIVKKGGQHTAYVADAGPDGRPMVNSHVYSLTFWNGIARDVETVQAQRFLDAGIASLDRPRLPKTDDDD